MNTAEQTLIAMLRTAITDELPAWSVASEEGNAVLTLAKKQKVGSLVCMALGKREAVAPLNETEAQIREALKKQVISDVFFDTRQMQALQKIIDALAEKGIPFAPLKGAILKKDYPQTNLRQMTDLDFCVPPEYREQVRQVMAALGAEEQRLDGNDPTFVLPDGVRVETHGGTFFRCDKKGMTEYETWDRDIIEEGHLTENAFALNLIGHTVKHLAKQGLGVRFILDLWIYRHRHQPQPDWNAVMEQLEKDGIGKVASHLLTLSEVWFGDQATDDPVITELGDFCLDGGLYGAAGRLTTNDASLAGSKAKAIRNRLFLTKEEYQKRYPFVKKHPILMPVAFFKRMFSILTKRRKSLKKWTKSLSETDSRAIRENAERMKRFGFQ